jgi:hypothetical protein
MSVKPSLFFFNPIEAMARERGNVRWLAKILRSVDPALDFYKQPWIEIWAVHAHPKILLAQ